MSAENIQEALKKRILILDGAMGTMLQRLSLQEENYRGERFKDHEQLLKGNNDLLSITMPEAICNVHRLYLEAGADIVETNTFGAQRISQADYGLSHLVRELNLAACQTARQAVDSFMAAHPERSCWVAGSIGPTGKTLSMSPDVADAAQRAIEFDELAAAYGEQIEALLDGGVDFLLLETIFDTLNAKAAIYAMDKVFAARGRRLPLMISVTITDRSGRTLCGQTVEAFWASVRHARPLLIGVNCALGAEEMRPHIQKLAEIANCYISCYPNAGLPNAMGGYDQTPAQMAAIIKGYAQEKLLNLVGGCCGTNPDYIQAIAQAVAGVTPRQPHALPNPCSLSGLEVYNISADTGFAMIGERTNLSGSAKFAKLIRSGDFEAALAVARQQVENGANLIDINLDDAMHNSSAVMTRFLRLLSAEPDIAKVPIMIDSSHWEVLQAGLKCLQGRSLVNSISLKEGEAAFVEKALEIRRLGGSVVVMSFDEKGQGVSLERKVAIAKRAYHILVDENAFDPADIFFDLAVLSVATGIEAHANYGKDFIEAVAEVKKTLPGVHILGGISNVSFAMRGNNAVREAMHSVFLYHAIKAGLDLGIVNAGMLGVYEELPDELRTATEAVILNTNPDATDHLLSIASNYKSAAHTGQTQEAAWRQLSAPERLVQAMVSGIGDFIEGDLDEAAQTLPSALQLIEGPLMDGMKKVGVLFGGGQMFLPQVVKSARVMKRAVAHLTASGLLTASAEQGGRAKILLATVKGDVHDIGKNIVSVVLGCNGYEVIDIGVMVPCADIIAKAIEHKVDAIGLSALITPSLDEMVNVAKEMERAGLKIPLLIGGAAASKMHTAVKIAPNYSGTTVYFADASGVTPVLNELTDAHKGAACAQAIADEYRKMAEAYEQKISNTVCLSLEDARRHAPKFDWQSMIIDRPDFEGVHVLRHVNLKHLVPLINWNEFFASWQMPGCFPAILDDAKRGEEARRLHQDALQMLDEIVTQQKLDASGVYAFLPANADGDDILVYEKSDRQKVLAVLPMLRRQQPNAEGICLSLADFIAPVTSDRSDWIGMFCLTTGLKTQQLQQQYRDKGDEYGALMVQTLSDRLCEAFSEYVHDCVRREWSYGREVKASLEDIKHSRYRGIRPAPGYPACPDHFLKNRIWSVLEPEKNVGIKLTSSAALDPASSVCGLYFGSPESKYFSLGLIEKDQVANYAQRWNIDITQAEQRLQLNLGYKK